MTPKNKSIAPSGAIASAVVSPNIIPKSPDRVNPNNPMIKIPMPMGIFWLPRSDFTLKNNVLREIRNIGRGYITHPICEESASRKTVSISPCPKKERKIRSANSHSQIAATVKTVCFFNFTPNLVRLWYLRFDLVFNFIVYLV